MANNQVSNTPITILALDTCTELCSAALVVNGQTYADQIDAPREHSQRLLPMIDSLLKKASMSLKDVDLIAYGRGPGSFTGIRICTSITQGLALGLEKPVIGISTLATMAQAAITKHGAKQVFASIDARMGEVYWGQFVDCDGIATLVGEEKVSKPEQVVLTLDSEAEICACGTGFDTYPELLELSKAVLHTVNDKLPVAESMLALAKFGFDNAQSTSVDELSPVYIRDTVTWKKLPGRE